MTATTTELPAARRFRLPTRLPHRRLPHRRRLHRRRLHRRRLHRRQLHRRRLGRARRPTMPAAGRTRRSTPTNCSSP